MFNLRMYEPYTISLYWHMFSCVYEYYNIRRLQVVKGERKTIQLKLNFSDSFIEKNIEFSKIKIEIKTEKGSRSKNRNNRLSREI